MGKGDKKTRRGKILMGSYGVRRPKRKVKSVLPPPVALVPEIPVKAEKEKAHAKPKVEKEEVVKESPVMETPVEEAVKPARKKAPPKATAKKEK